MRSEVGFDFDAPGLDLVLREKRGEEKRREEKMRGRARQNAMRSGVVVVGALAFAYLSFRIGFKPYLDRAQQEQEQELSSQLQQPHDSQSSDASGARPDENRDAAAVVLKD